MSYCSAMVNHNDILDWQYCHFGDFRKYVFNSFSILFHFFFFNCGHISYFVWKKFYIWQIRIKNTAQQSTYWILQIPIKGEDILYLNSRSPNFFQKSWIQLVALQISIKSFFCYLFVELRRAKKVFSKASELRINELC